MTINNNKIFMYVLALVALTLCVYAPALQNDFVNWDDDEYVLTNTHIQSLDPESIINIFTTDLAGKYHPLTILSYAVEYHFVKLDPFTYHSTNVFFHLMNVLLVFVFASLLLGNITLALFVATLFSIHPLNVEPVAWVSSRKDMLFMFFYMLGLNAYLYAQQASGKQNKFTLATYAFFILGLLSKAMTITFPLVLILLDYLQEKKFTRKSVFTKWPYFLIALLYGIFTLSIVSKAGAFPNTALYPFWERILYSCLAFVLYSVKIIFPYPLTCFYALTNSWPVLILSALVTLGGLFLIFVTFRKNTFVSFCFLFYVATIWPVLHLIQMNDSLIYERFMYLPALGFFLLLATALDTLLKRTKKTLGIIASVVLALWLSGLIMITSRQITVWNNSGTLWNNVIKHYPQSYPPYYKMGLFLEENTRFDEAMIYFMRMVEINPEYAEGYFKMANILALKFDRIGAIRYYSKAIEYNPKHLTALNNRGNQYLINGMHARALKDYNATLELDDTYINAYVNRGMCYFAMKNYPKAIEDFNKVLELKPDHRNAREKLNAIYKSYGL